MENNILTFPIKPSVISIELPNGKVFTGTAAELKLAFENTNVLSDEDKDGFIKLAIAIVYADHLQPVKASMI